MHVIVAGAGIAGTALAVALARDGADVTVLEARPRAADGSGTWLTLAPNGIEALTALDLAAPAVSAGFATPTMQLRDARCRLLATLPDASRDDGLPPVSLSRAALHGVLRDAAAAAGADLRHDQRVGGVEQGLDGDDARVRVRLADGTALDGDVLVGADGLHSAVRRTFHPEEGSPVFHGINMWRGVTEARPFLTGASATRIGALRRTGKLSVYPIRDDIDGGGTQLVNWVAEVVTDAASPTDWSAPGRLEDFIGYFEDWRFDWLDCNALIRDAEGILSYPMVDRDPVHQWSFGRVTLLGDAAHPMYPRGGNGAAQAILDAESLATHLAAGADPVAALAAYEAERLPVANAIVLANRATPPDTLIETVEERTGGGRFERIEDVISRDEIDAVSLGYQRVAGYDVETVARR